MTGRTVLVVGGAGYIGAHTCKALSAAGYLPVTYDNLSTGHRDFVKWGPLIEGDILDTAAVTQAVRDNRVDAVLHFAAHAYVGESILDPAKYYENNVRGSLSLLRGMREADCQLMVFSSTCAIYGQPDQMPIHEGVLPNPVNPYGASKLMVERVLADYGRAYGLKSIALRYFNACGADPDGQIGELRDPETHLIPRAMMAIQGHIDDFRVFGSDYPTEDGTAVRDYIHVSDLAAAHVAALRLLCEGHRGGAFNLGTGIGYSVKAVLDAIQEEARAPLPAARDARREGDPVILVADPTEARGQLGFDPRFSDLKTIVRTAWAWHQRAHPNRRKAGDNR